MRFTSTGYIELFKDGVFISRHRVAEEAYENAAENGVGRYVVKYPDREIEIAGTSTSEPAVEEDMGLLASRTRSPASVTHGYTVTHYVAPYAQVSGATSDGQDQGATAYSNATNSGTPCTFGTSLARASAGNVIELASGVYDAVGTSGGDGAAFQVGVTGTSGSKIIYTAKYPAAYNASNRTQLRNTDTPVAGVLEAPVIKLNSHAIVDGLYFSYADGGLPSTRGVIYFGFSVTGAEIRRCRFDRTDLGSSDDGDNFNCIQYHTSTDCKILDCHFYNGYDDGGSHNEACITTYDGANLTIEHNYFENVTIGIFIKGNANDGTYGFVRYNHLKNCFRPVELSATHGSNTNVLEIAQNLITLQDATADQSGLATLSFDNSAPQNRYFLIHHNTIINGSTGSQPIYYESGWNGTGCVFRDNIVASFVNTSQPTVNVQGALTNWTTWDYNRYYENGNTIEYYLNPTLYNSIANWRTASSRDTNSTEGDPGFSDQASGDYHLAGGSPCLTLSSTSGPLGCYITGSEEIGLRASPTY